MTWMILRVNKKNFCALLCLILVAPQYAHGDSTAYSECVLDTVEKSGDEMTATEIKAFCSAQTTKEEGVVEARLEKDKKNTLAPFTVMSHRPNYVLLGAYNDKGYNAEPFREASGDPDVELDDTEAQFQLSLKVPLGLNLFNRNLDVFAAYTVRSFWQVYNDEESAPFRETNHEPEIWLQAYPGWELLGFKNSIVQLGINHQSNGRNDPLSRSWNRVFANFVLEKDNLVLGFKPWARISEDDEDDDNPDITDFMGHFELRGVYKWNEHVFSLMSRNNLESGFEEGAFEAGWSFPLGKWPFLKGYVQYFNGYGESMIDYDQKVNRIGVGLLLTDYL
jgi:phospholipase A1